VTTPIYELGDLVTIRKGKKAVEVSEGPSEGFLRYIQIEDLRNNDSMKYARNPKGPICDENDVLIAWDGAKAGTIGFGLSGLVGSTIAILRPNESVYAPYLGMILQSKYQMIRDACTGATIPHVSKPFLLRMNIPLPSIPEQKRIAATLDKTNEIEQNAKNIEKMQAELIQSVFLEMFLPIIENPESMEVVPLSELLLFLTSGSRGWAKYYSDKGSIFIRIQNVRNGKLILDDVAYVNAPDSSESRRTRVQSGDVLLSITADLGRTAVVPPNLGDAHINQHLAILRPNRKRINPTFLAMYLESQGGSRQLFKSNKGGTKAGLNFADIRSIRIPLPSIEEQEKFEAFVCNARLIYDSVEKEVEAAKMLNQSSIQLLVTQ